MPPLFRIDAGKKKFFTLLMRVNDKVFLINWRKKTLKARLQLLWFKGLGEMNPQQLRETTMNRDTRRLVQLSVSNDDNSEELMDMLLAKKRASERRQWLEDKGDLAEV